jgi:hypothetical protein
VSQTDYSGPINVQGTRNNSGVLPSLTPVMSVPNGPGLPGYSSYRRLTTAIADSTATTLFTINVPNRALRGSIHLWLSGGITNTSHTYDSVRTQEYLIAITRVPGAAAVAVISATFGAQIATSSGGQTFTMTGSIAAVSGGVTAVNTLAVQVTNVNASAGTTEVDCFIELFNSFGTIPAGTMSTPVFGITIT